jgi:N-acetyl-gamma-glutamylphosphate reductase
VKASGVKCVGLRCTIIDAIASYRIKHSAAASASYRIKHSASYRNQAQQYRYQPIL